MRLAFRLGTALNPRSPLTPALLRRHLRSPTSGLMVSLSWPRGPCQEENDCRAQLSGGSFQPSAGAGLVVAAGTVTNMALWLLGRFFTGMDAREDKGLQPLVSWEPGALRHGCTRAQIRARNAAGCRVYRIAQCRSGILPQEGSGLWLSGQAKADTVPEMPHLCSSALRSAPASLLLWRRPRPPCLLRLFVARSLSRKRHRKHSKPNLRVPYPVNPVHPAQELNGFFRLFLIRPPRKTLVSHRKNPWAKPKRPVAPIARLCQPLLFPLPETLHPKPYTRNPIHPVQRVGLYIWRPFSRGSMPAHPEPPQVTVHGPGNQRNRVLPQGPQSGDSPCSRTRGDSPRFAGLALVSPGTAARCPRRRGGATRPWRRGRCRF